MRAWVGNAVALTITFLFWYFQPRTSVHGLVFAAYMAAKACYVWLLLRGALALSGWRPRWISASIVVPILVALCIAGIFVVTTRDLLGLVASIVIALGFGLGTIVLARTRPYASLWLGIGFGARAALGAAEAVAYALSVASGGDLARSAFVVPANAILAAHYTFDTGTEWLVAMGCILAMTERTQRELRQAATQMLAAQENLRRLVDRDPLTSLANRRMLPEVLRAVQPQGALLVFFDLNEFKRINDEHGHQAGDECLTRFAAALTECFRPGDAVIRYAGDEFLVVASGLNESAVETRIDAVRARVRSTTTGVLSIQFSYGIGHLAAGGSPDDAIRAADAAMYRAKPASASRAAAAGA
jgi:diguanylate cyclase (GGDEF)-like protein